MCHRKYLDDFQQPGETVLAEAKTNDNLNIRQNYMKKYCIEQLDGLEALQCSCGTARRAFIGTEDSEASVHLVDISRNSKTHYHRQHTEVYLILEGEGQLELDGEIINVKPMTSVLIKPGCRHRAIGEMRIVNISIPSYDADDEWFD